MNWPERVWIYSPLRVFFLRREARRWLNQAGSRQVDMALEIGCGLGRGACILVEELGFKRVIAFDLEEKLIRRSLADRPGHLRERIDFMVADAQDFPFPRASFDAVVNFGIIHHVLDWRRCMGEIARVLAPGGHFYFEEIFPPLYANILMRHIVRHPREDRFDRDMFLEALRSRGLRVLDTVSSRSRFGLVGVAVREAEEFTAGTQRTRMKK
ncbi:MAG: class I SAM-dependent methyltransferase [Thermodesulfobacteriota bacterium]